MANHSKQQQVEQKVEQKAETAPEALPPIVDGQPAAEQPHVEAVAPQEPPAEAPQPATLLAKVAELEKRLKALEIDSKNFRR